MTCMSMSTTTSTSLRVVFNYCITCVSITKRHVIALLYCYTLAIIVEAIVGKMTFGVKTGGSRVGGPELCV